MVSFNKTDERPPRHPAAYHFTIRSGSILGGGGGVGSSSSNKNKPVRPRIEIFSYCSRFVLFVGEMSSICPASRPPPPPPPEFVYSFFGFDFATLENYLSV